jgi:putative tricarboxylic transport membrane protein
MLFCITGMYTVNNSVNDIWLMLLMGALGYLMRKWAYDAAPLLLALVIGPKMEVAFRQSLMISHGDFGIFINRPVSLVFLLAMAIFLMVPVFRLIFKKMKKGGDLSVRSS